MDERARDPAGPAGAADQGQAPGLPELPRLPLRASIYIDPDGTVQFGALFEELLPVAQALGTLADGLQAPALESRGGAPAAAQRSAEAPGRSHRERGG